MTKLTMVTVTSYDGRSSTVIGSGRRIRGDTLVRFRLKFTRDNAETSMTKASRINATSRGRVSDIVVMLSCPKAGVTERIYGCRLTSFSTGSDGALCALGGRRGMTPNGTAIAMLIGSGTAVNGSASLSAVRSTTACRASLSTLATGGKVTRTKGFLVANGGSTVVTPGRGGRVAIRMTEMTTGLRRHSTGAFAAGSRTCGVALGSCAFVGLGAGACRVTSGKTCTSARRKFFRRFITGGARTIFGRDATVGAVAKTPTRSGMKRVACYVRGDMTTTPAAVMCGTATAFASRARRATTTTRNAKGVCGCGNLACTSFSSLGGVSSFRKSLDGTPCGLGGGDAFRSFVGCNVRLCGNNIYCCATGVRAKASGCMVAHGG